MDECFVKRWYNAVIIKGIVDEDFVNYKVPSMEIIFPYCSFKCDKEAGKSVCQNSSLAQTKNMEVEVTNIVSRYLCNPITKAVVMCGLEPLDSFEDVKEFIQTLRKNDCLDDVVIYTGYNEDEVSDRIRELEVYKNIIVKFGRFRYGDKSHFDNVLGVNLASDNQYAKKIGTA
jgi:hypothetical protein